MALDEIPCPCYSGKKYMVCCQVFHGGKIPENAEQLMRSRYSAYVLNLPDYIIATTHPASPQYTDNFFHWKRSIAQFSKTSVFQKLDILDFKERGHLATVTFTAHLLQDGQDATFTERSFFEKKDQRWLYLGGQLAEGHVPNMVTTGQLRLLPLAYYGDPILRRKADPIGEITPDIRKLAEEMIETMDASNGIGLAAPQIHHSIRLFIMRTPIESEEGKVEWGEVKVLINPSLSEPSEETWKSSEGCLSIPGIRAQVERPKEINVEYTDLNGQLVRERFKGWAARVFQHEYDHINGVLFVDRVDEEVRLKLLPELEKLKSRIHDGREL
jgi:peptide deformylase